MYIVNFIIICGYLMLLISQKLLPMDCINLDRKVKEH